MFSKENRVHTLNGILFVAFFACASLYLAQNIWFIKMGISSLVVAIILGIFYSNTLRHKLPTEWTPGIEFSAKKLLRLAIILYGFRITFQQILSVGAVGAIIDIIIVVSTLGLGYLIGTRLLKLDRHLSILIAAGSAICGAAAVLAVEDIIKSEPYKATVAVGTVVLFGSLGMFIYPIIQHAGIWMLSNMEYGIFAGATVHEVAQALVAGNDVSSQAGNVAVIVKMTRVLLLIPVLFFLSLCANRQNDHSQTQTQPTKKFNVPWFAVGFAAVIGFHSLGILPTSIVSLLNQLDVFLLTMAMAAIGIETNFNKIKHVGIKPLYLAILLFGWLTFAGITLVKIF